jgi:hypothetical protein
MLEELYLPCEISVAPGIETTDRELPVDTHSPYVVCDSAGEWLDASYVVTPLRERFPCHRLILAESDQDPSRVSGLSAL